MSGHATPGLSRFRTVPIVFSTPCEWSFEGMVRRRRFPMQRLLVPPRGSWCDGTSLLNAEEVLI